MMSKPRGGVAVLFLLAMILHRPAYAQEAAPRFAGIFGDHAVLQRDEPLTIWGTAAPSQAVSVKLGDRSLETVADKLGAWRITLPKQGAGGPYTLSARSASGEALLNDIMVGDVYLCGGQSNMEFPARLSAGAWGDFPANPDLRFAIVENTSSAAPRQDFDKPVAWKTASPKTLGEASAVCYYMARSLQKELKVPVGFISADWGGTTIQSWISPAAMQTMPGYDDRIRAVADLAANPARALAADARRQEAWWDAHDPQAKAQRAWISPAFDDAGWPQMVPSGSWKDAGVADLAEFDGAAWFRTTVVLTDQQAQDANLLALGPIDTYDSTWVNGVNVGANSTSWAWREYPVQPGVFKPGRNVIVVRVLSGGAGGGLTGLPENRVIKTRDGQQIPLTEPWRYQRGSALKGLSIAPPPWVTPTSISTLHNGMIAPLAGYKFKLAAWYQGEANTGDAKEYEKLLPLLFSDWRRTFDQPRLPFLVVQLSAFGSVATTPGNSGWAELRQAQAVAVRGDPYAGLAVSVDVGDRVDVHPAQKAVVGERLARAARAVVYGLPVTPGSPEAVSVTRVGDDLVISFKNAKGGLQTYSAGVAIGFEVCEGAACKYALGAPQGDKIILAGANRPSVTRVRYAWADSPYVNLYSGEDLPVVPFALDVN